MAKQVTISQINNGQRIMVQAPYNAEMLAELKAIEGRVWRPEEKAWTFKIADDAKVREIVAKYYPDGEDQEKQEYVPESNILRYQDIVLDGVRRLLWNVEENGGKLNKNLILKHLEDEKGHYAQDGANVVLEILGIEGRLKGAANDRQLGILVKKAREKFEYAIASIEKKKQAAREQKSQAEVDGTSTAKISRKSKSRKPLSPALAAIQLTEGFTVRKIGRALKVVPAKANHNLAKVA